MKNEDLTQTQASPAAEEILPEIEGLPKTLVAALGGVAVLMLLCGVGVLMLHYWDRLHEGIQIAGLLIPTILMWGGYMWGRAKGYRSGELTGACACVSWLVALLAWQVFSPATPNWVVGVLFVAGTLGVAVVFPNRTSVVMLAVAGVVELGLLWYSSTNGGEYPAGVLLWMGAVSLLCMWGLGGFICGLTRHAVYAPYAFLGPWMFSICLVVLQGVIIYLPVLPGNSWQSWAWGALIWLAPTLLFGWVHRLMAQGRGKPVLSFTFLILWAMMYAVLPLGLWAGQTLPWIFGAIPLFLFAVCMVRYGAVYRSAYAMIAGCSLVFMVAVGTAFGRGGSLVGGGVMLLLLGAAFLCVACVFYRRRRQLQQSVLLARKRQQLHAS